MSDYLDTTSPCRGCCKVNEHDTCIGCHRTLAEIATWSTLTSQQKHRINQRLIKPKPTQIATKIGQS
ncbi:DUF1289 domain-containing protein [Alteromonas sp. 345S023]|uniref:DUF1289 domain-containing protein n=1 Tax=Alteromonas profundi TaxID=2696062 RepID=A0A7X5LKC3_9ALTE|nr:DUF1289 domain-containing protein [Alteromonas profundi]NDV90957.1 DUF1289 domain-containing protein [Alteromonas profundi]